MRYKVYDEEDKKERTLEECVTPLEVGSVRRVQIKKGEAGYRAEVRYVQHLQQVYKGSCILTKTIEPERLQG